MVANGPSALLHTINGWLHVEPFSTVANVSYWLALLIVTTPLCLVVLPFRGLWKLLARSRPGNATYYDPLASRSNSQSQQQQDSKINKDLELAVFISGCDTGFGKEVALLAASRGFVVFAGCLQESSLKQFQTMDNMSPLIVDVTKDQQVLQAAEIVQEWIHKGKATGKERALHAVVNNAGIGMGGLIDWMELDFFQKVMDVNYFGVIRVCKAFLPLLKYQASQQTHVGARVVNIVSMAGLVAGGHGMGAYGPSKFAAQCFSTVLRLELKAFNVQVCTINPSFHGTPLVDTMRPVVIDTWQSLEESQRQEYGDAFFDRYLELSVDIPHSACWKIDAVVSAVMTAIQSRYIADPEVLIGMDARFGLVALRMLPAWVIDLLDAFMPRPLPSIMKQKRVD